VTKKNLVEYYTKISKWILPELVGRPLSLVRCPDGIQGECFFQKHLGEGTPKSIMYIPIEEKGKTGIYPVVEDLNDYCHWFSWMCWKFIHGVLIRIILNIPTE